LCCTALCYKNPICMETKHTTRPSQWYLLRIWSWKRTWIFYLPHTSQNPVLNTGIKVLLYLVKFLLHQLLALPHYSELGASCER
jgi:hypothetical protein